MNFSDLNVSPELVTRLEVRGITTPSPIQIEALPPALEGRDLIGRARTGTGKTLAFAIPIIEKMQPSRERGRLPRAIILAPTRELAKQVAGEFEQSAPDLRTVTVYGGAPYSPQERALMGGVDIVVGTPGRITDHIDRGNLDLSAVEFAVLDEADEMLNVGFLEPVENILEKTPATRQTLFFSATLTPEVKRLANRYLRTPVTVDLVSDSASKTSQTVEHVAVVVGRSRTRALADLLTVYNPERTIVFTRTKREVDELALELIHRGLEAEGIHGDLAQVQRERALASFRAGLTRVLVATDVAARGLDIPEVDLVVQFHLPNDTEAYIHRSGRTGRAGRAGRAVVLHNEREGRGIRNLEHATGVQFVRREVPRPQEVQAALVNGTVQTVRGIKSEVALPFLEQAEVLIKELGAEALARALAKLAGVSEPARSVSLLSGEEDMTTVMVRGERLSIPRTVAIICRATNLDSKLLGKVRVFDGGTVLDIPTPYLGKLLESAGQLEDEVTVEVATDLPEMQEVRDDRREGGGYRGNSDRGGSRGYQGGGGGYRGNQGSSSSRGGYQGSRDSSSNSSSDRSRPSAGRSQGPREYERR